VYLRSDGDHEDKLVQLFRGLGGRAGEGGREEGEKESLSLTVGVVAKTVFKNLETELVTEVSSPRSGLWPYGLETDIRTLVI